MYTACSALRTLLWSDLFTIHYGLAKTDAFAAQSTAEFQQHELCGVLYMACDMCSRRAPARLKAYALSCDIHLALAGSQSGITRQLRCYVAQSTIAAHCETAKGQRNALPSNAGTHRFVVAWSLRVHYRCKTNGRTKERKKHTDKYRPEQ